MPFVPPDRGPVVRVDRGPDLDQGAPADDGPAGDAWVDPDDGVPRDARVGADGGDMAPVVSPRPVDPQAVVVLRARPDAWVAWVADGALWAVRMDQQGGLGEPRRVTAVPDGFTGPLLGGRSGIQPAWVVLPNGANGQLQAYDLADAAAAPVPLNLWPPAQVAVTGTAQHIIGRSGPGAGDPLAWRTLAHPGAEPPPPEDVGAEDMGADAGEDTPADPADPRTLDVKGMADPIAASAGLADHVLAFQSGMCAAVLGEGRLGNAWPCGARPGAQLMGFDKQMVFVGQRGGQLATWDGTPAAADRTPVAVADLTDGITWLPPVGSVRFLIAGEPDGRYLWWFEFDRVKRSAQPVAADVLAASFSVLLPDQALLLAWSEDGTLRVDTVALQAVDRASALPPLDADCLASTVLPEDCDARDQDCDGAPRNGLCCQDRGAQPTRARLPERVEGPWFTGVGDGYMLLLTGDGQQAELRRLTPAVDGAEPA
ncbi:MAG: hypothetical protein KC613_23085, partial [Myxococcales bacterium]|nr:hypothetical protein [Myxococcales bacterium]